MPGSALERIDAWEPWSWIRGHLVVPSSTAEIFGGAGLAEAEVVAAAVELGQWLVTAGSSFEKSSRLSGLRDFAFGSRPQVGERLDLKVTLRRQDWDDILCACDITSARRFIARGSFTLEALDVGDPQDSERLRFLWLERGGDQPV